MTDDLVELPLLAALLSLMGNKIVQAKIFARDSYPIDVSSEQPGSERVCFFTKFRKSLRLRRREV